MIPWDCFGAQDKAVPVVSVSYKSALQSPNGRLEKDSLSLGCNLEMELTAWSSDFGFDLLYAVKMAWDPQSENTLFPLDMHDWDRRAL